jgi:hypothetical protein
MMCHAAGESEDERGTRLDGPRRRSTSRRPGSGRRSPTSRASTTSNGRSGRSSSSCAIRGATRRSGRASRTACRSPVRPEPVRRCPPARLRPDSLGSVASLEPSAWSRGVTFWRTATIRTLMAKATLDNRPSIECRRRLPATLGTPPPRGSRPWWSEFSGARAEAGCEDRRDHARRASRSAAR